jgi:HPr kinase/phosphorylase
MAEIVATHPTHASCVAIGRRAVLLRGPSGSGKSDLALRLLDEGGILVADDQVVLEARDGMVFASPPDALAGKIEVRGIGILENQPWQTATVSLVADLVSSAEIDRLPDPTMCLVKGISLPRIDLAPFEASAAAKLRLYLASLEANRSTRDSAPE